MRYVFLSSTLVLLSLSLALLFFWSHWFTCDVIPFSDLHHTCVIPVSYFRHASVVPSSYIRRTFVIPSSCLCHTFSGSKKIIDGNDACDISLEALDLAKENSEINNLKINLFQSDLLSGVEEMNYDIIVANLPYIPTETLSNLESEVVDYEPLVALDGGNDGLLYINRLVKEIEVKDIKNLTLFLEVDTSHATTILNNLSH